MSIGAIVRNSKQIIKFYLTFSERFGMMIANEKAMKVYSSVSFSVRERESPAESFLKFKRNVEFPTGAVRAKFVWCQVFKGRFGFRYETKSSSKRCAR